jgi:hypothetical protein
MFLNFFEYKTYVMLNAVLCLILLYFEIVVVIEFFCYLTIYLIQNIFKNIYIFYQQTIF